MSKNNIEAIYPLSPLQQGLLFHALYDPESEDYFEQLSCTIQGPLDVSAFVRSWQQVIDRHPILRTMFMWHGLDKPLQVVRQSVVVPFEQQDWRARSAAEQQQQLTAWLAADRRRGFQLSVAPLMRLLLIELSERRYQFVWSSHHLLLDGWSLSLILKEVFAYYGAYSQGRELALAQSRPYRDYIAWLQQQDLSQAEAHWRQTLKGFSTPTALGIGGNSVSSSRQRKIYRPSDASLSAEVTAELQGLARRQQLTLNTLVQGAWAVLLSRYSGEMDVLFGTVVSGRPASLPGVEQMVGLFINTLPLRVQVAPEQQVIDWLRQLQEQQVEMRQYEHSPLVDVQGWSDVPRGLPLFDTLIVFENYPMDKALEEREEELSISNVGFVEQTNYPITVAVMPGSELSLRVTYDDGLYAVETIKRMLGHFQSLLEGIATNAERRLSEISILSIAEQQLLKEWEEGRGGRESEELAHEMFERQAAERPEAMAVRSGNREMSYRELNERANQIGHYLQEQGVGGEQRVGVLMERSVEQVAAVLGIMKVGGVYVPLDPGQPGERLRYMMEDAGVGLVLTRREWQEVVEESGVRRVNVDEEEMLGESRENPGVESGGESLAYLIYTSGSSGQPKAVAVEQGQMAQTLRASREEFEVGATDRLLSLSSISFDISLWEMMLPLVSGAGVELVSREEVVDVGRLAERVREVTLLHAVPTLMQPLVRYLEGQGGVTNLRQVFVGGEAVSGELLREMEGVFGEAQLQVLYGPTEATMICTSYKAGRGVRTEKQMIGKGLAGVRLSIRDTEQQRAPVGVSGELWIGGGGVSRGYLNQEELTAAKYVQEGEERWYRSGDRARWLGDGNLEFLGREDDQVKVRGYRIELGEVEAVLGRHAGVGQAVVMAREERGGEKRLVGYVVAAAGEAAPGVSELRRHLEEQLPEYMIPTAFVYLEQLPLTSNGKVDRRALPEVDRGRPDLADAYIPPRTEVERSISSVWQEVLKINEVGMNDNFFDMGGNSLLAIEVHDKLKGNLGRDFPMVEIFKCPTVSSLAKYLGREEDGRSSFQPIYDRAEKQRAASNRQRQLAVRRAY